MILFGVIASLVVSIGLYYYLHSRNNLVVRLLDVGTGFTAHAICSALFVSKLPEKVILANEIAGLAASMVDYQINYEKKYVDAFPLSSKLFRVPFARAWYVNKQLGCRLEIEPTEKFDLYRQDDFRIESSQFEFPTDINPVVQAFIDREFSTDAAIVNQTRATVIVHQGKLIAENYQGAVGVAPATPLIGWSMTKSLQAAVIGAAIQNQLISLTSTFTLPLRRGNQTVTLKEMLTMTDILDFNEDYSIHASVPAMLYQSGDCSSFAQSDNERVIIDKPADLWYYSSGLSNILSHEFSKLFDSLEDYWMFPFRALLGKIGANSFSFETDAAGTFIASSFSYATARDWAKLGQLFLQNGVWNDERIISADLVELARQPRENSGGHYGGSFWLNPACITSEEYDAFPNDHPHKLRREWMLNTLPADAYFMSGYNGQYTFIIPSLELVVVRLGFTPDVAPGTPKQFDEGAYFGGIAALVQQLR